MWSWTNDCPLGPTLANAWEDLWQIRIASKYTKQGGFPGGSDGKGSACNVGRPTVYPWVQKSPWSMKWQPTPIFLPRRVHGQRSLAGHSPRGLKESDTDWAHMTKQAPSEHVLKTDQNLT